MWLWSHNLITKGEICKIIVTTDKLVALTIGPFRCMPWKPKVVMMECRHWRHQRLSLRRPPVQPVTTKLSYSVRVPGWQLKSLNFITNNSRFSGNERGSVMWLATGQKKTPACCHFEKSYWEIDYDVTTGYLVWAQNKHAIFIAHDINI